MLILKFELLVGTGSWKLDIKQKRLYTLATRQIYMLEAENV